MGEKEFVNEELELLKISDPYLFKMSYLRRSRQIWQGHNGGMIDYDD